MKNKVSIFIIATAFLLLGITTTVAQETKAYFKKDGVTVFQSAISDIDSIIFVQKLEIPDIISVTIPQGTIATKTPKVELLKDTELYSTLDEFKDFIYLTTISNYQIKIDIGYEYPFSEDIQVSMNIPSDLQQQIINGEKPIIVALIYQDGGEEILDNFEPIFSTYNEQNNTVNGKLPFEAFTNARTGKYETILSLAFFNASMPYKMAIMKTNSEADIQNNGCTIDGIFAVPNREISSPFGSRCDPKVLQETGKCIMTTHYGIDHSVPVGSPVVAVFEGTVERVKINNGGINVGYGLYIIIDHGTQGKTLYGHLSEVKVKEGEKVTKGQLIALSGNTGKSTGPHIHIDHSKAPDILNNSKKIDISTCLNRDYSIFPEIKKPKVSNIKSTSATLRSEIVISEDINYSRFYVCGFWYDTQPNPQNSGKFITLTGNISGEFISDVENLTPETTYYVRAFTYYNSIENIPFYSDVEPFTTGKVQPAKISTIQINNKDITETSAVVYGNITDKGDPSYTEKGICWSSHSNSTINDNKDVSWSSDYIGEYTEYLGDFSGNLTGLKADNTYYARAYVIQNNYPIYGNEISFNTPPEEDEEPDWVLINGVKWATRNVGTPGTFVENPEDYGGYYQWNRGTQNIMLHDDYFNSINSTASSWQSANDPSPAGYRVPTLAEIQSLLDGTYVTNSWTVQNGAYGKKFTDRASGKSIFLPSPGSRDGHSDGVHLAGSHGQYWSSDLYDGTGCTGCAFFLYFFGTSGATGWSYGGCRCNGFSVRSVLK